MESTDGSLAWRNLISSSVLGGFQDEGVITGGKAPGKITGGKLSGESRGNHRGSSPRPDFSSPKCYTISCHVMSYTAHVF